MISRSPFRDIFAALLDDLAERVGELIADHVVATFHPRPVAGTAGHTNARATRGPGPRQLPVLPIDERPRARGQGPRWPRDDRAGFPSCGRVAEGRRLQGGNRPVGGRDV